MRDKTRAVPFFAGNDDQEAAEWRWSLETVLSRLTKEYGLSKRIRAAELADLIEFSWKDLERHFAKKREISKGLQTTAASGLGLDVATPAIN